MRWDVGFITLSCLCFLLGVRPWERMAPGMGRIRRWKCKNSRVVIKAVEQVKQDLHMQANQKEFTPCFPLQAGARPSPGKLGSITNNSDSGIPPFLPPPQLLLLSMVSYSVEDLCGQSGSAVSPPSSSLGAAKTLMLCKHHSATATTFPCFYC